jgi:hypothetical protein
MYQAVVVTFRPALDAAGLRQGAIAHPGTTWLISNEPNVANSVPSDTMTPQLYATTLHATAAIIRAADPTALIVGPNVLNWVDTCIGCPGYTTGAAWTQQFYEAYQQQYGVRPPIDRWAIHTYELDWSATPMLDPEFDIRQFVALRQWLDSKPEERGRPIWNTELGVVWAYTSYALNAQHQVAPAGRYDEAGLNAWLDRMMTWLTGDGQRMGVERWFFFADISSDDPQLTTYGGMALYQSREATNSPLTAAGARLLQFLRTGS